MEEDRRGHRLLEHTADMALEAWAPTRTECLAEAVQALVGSFVDLSVTQPDSEISVRLSPTDDDDLLLHLLDEVIYQIDVYGHVPVDAEIEETDEGGLIVHLAAAGPGGIEVIGAVPKAVSLHELALRYEGGHWRCHATVDV